MERTAKIILKGHGLRQTDCRSEVLKLLLEKEVALNHADLEQSLSKDFDRVTLYRTLNTFLDHGIVHRILDDTGMARFALCPEECDEDHHHHNHVHFKCISCNSTICLDEVKVPDLNLPQGYAKSDMDVLIQGTCPKCDAA